ncbi:MAG TPA: DUF1559 domain-containing protein [Pirellulaceae bacterium]|nr:DUF1559 domain-containing protein [Pirellulaceae bacterium]
MPIAYSCPHCGKQYSVADQYAGQTGPCASCGKSISIPLVGAGAYAPRPAGGGGGGIAIAIAAIVVVLFLCAGGGVALILPAVQAAREAARRAQSSNNLKQIGIAMHNYHDVYNTFPPAVVTGANGQPLYSGRVLLLPFMEQSNLFEAWAKDKAWDSPENMALSQTAIKVFQDPSNANTGNAAQTDYVFVTGTGTIFDPALGRGTRLQDITDGTSNTIMVIEMRGSGINWAEPRDIDMSAAIPLPPSSHAGGNVVLFADGSVRNISTNVPPTTVHALTTRSGGEPATLP